jgi:hypothetical protein
MILFPNSHVTDTCNLKNPSVALIQFAKYGEVVLAWSIVSWMTVKTFKGLDMDKALFV